VIVTHHFTFFASASPQRRQVMNPTSTRLAATSSVRHTTHHIVALPPCHYLMALLSEKLGGHGRHAYDTRRKRNQV